MVADKTFIVNKKRLVVDDESKLEFRTNDRIDEGGKCRVIILRTCPLAQ